LDMSHTRWDILLDLLAFAALCCLSHDSA
jgi:hypothetical protein